MMQRRKQMINNFSLSPGNLPNLIAKLNQLDLSLGYVVTAKPRKSTRSHSQNDLYWKFVTEFGNHFGYDKDFTHDMLRYKFLFKVVNYDGEEAKQLLSTTKQDTKAMSEYLDNCIRYAAENGFVFNDQG
jgi:hypothetical protein